MAVEIYPLDRPAPISHERLPELCEKISCQGQPCEVPLHSSLLPHQNCYWNVRASAEDGGGSIVFGWMLRCWPGVYLAAEHHAVWRRDAGLVDVTQRRPQSPVPTTFVQDKCQDYDLDRAPNVPIEFLPLSSDGRITDVIRYARELNELAGRTNDFVAGDLGLGSSMHMSIARGIRIDKVAMTLQQYETYQAMNRETADVQSRLADVFESLKANPPNATARRAMQDNFC